MAHSGKQFTTVVVPEQQNPDTRFVIAHARRETVTAAPDYPGRIALTISGSDSRLPAGVATTTMSVADARELAATIAQLADEAAAFFAGTAESTSGSKASLDVTPPAGK